MITRLFALFFLGLLLQTGMVSSQNALHFDGTNDYIQTNQPSISGSASRSIEAWIKIPSTTSTTQKVIVDMGSTATGARFTLNVINGQNLRIEVAGSGVTGLVDVTDNNWHHVAVTFNNANAAGTKAKLYVDGVLDAQGDLTSVNTATGNIRMGSRIDGLSFFEGSMDEVRVWNTERTAAQILSDKSISYCTIPATLITFYRFNQGTASGANAGLTNAINTANATYSGTLTGFALTGASSNWVTGVAISNSGFIAGATISPVACGAYTSPGNKVYTTSGTYQDTLSSSNGCDSIITINLTIGVATVNNLSANNITSATANLKWSTTPNVAGYQYVLDQTLAAPAGAGIATTDTFYNASGLNPVTTYYMHVRAACGSSFSAWQTISFTTSCIMPTITTTTDSFRCGSGTVVLKATGTGTSVKWYAAATGGSALFTGSPFTTSVIAATTPYYVSTVNASGCESGRTLVTATVRPLPQVNLGPDKQICPGVNTPLNGTSTTPNVTYLWSTAAQTPSISVNTPGSYILTVNDGICQNKDTIVVSTAPAPVVNLADTVKICAGHTAVLDAGNAGATFLWNTGATSQILNVTAGGLYKVTVTNSLTCTGKDSIYVLYYAPVVVNLGADTIICQDASISLDAANTGCTYQWNTGATAQTIQVDQPGNYTVMVTDQHACFGYGAITVTEYGTLALTGINYVKVFELTPGRVDFEPNSPAAVQHYLWNFGDGNTSTEMNPSHIYTASGNYTVTLRVRNACDTIEKVRNISIDLNPTGIHQVHMKETAITVYPVPAKDQLTIKAVEKTVLLQKISLTDAFGRMVAEYDGMARSYLELQLHNIAAGNYFIKIETNKGIIVRHITVSK
ncbi:LamG-like jellyroll fold domain-containing protein [Edaphocola aurantiacus]|uniref:LamG-like jellyroll fold domain-containing protein n=1 Tax=Edaphocola aurantiacus TaxID=2601682 RepID=UPI001C96B968|nr:LamG-like jellyroll fold domain-containing protein [Edaphocola aurantiacus]